MATEMELKIAALKKELAEAEKAESLSKSEKELADAKATLEGRAYLFNHDQGSWINARIVLYEKVTRDKHSGRMEVSSRSLSAVKYATPKGAYEIHRDKDRYAQSFDSTCQLLLYNKGEIPKADFLRMWKAADGLGDCFMRWLTADFKSPRVDLQDGDMDLRTDEQEALDIDVKYVTLDPCDANMLPQRFQLAGRRYILTPASIKAGLRRLHSEDDRLARGSHLYEACDMRYVEATYAQISRLRAALT